MRIGTLLSFLFFSSQVFADNIKGSQNSDSCEWWGDGLYQARYSYSFDKAGKYYTYLQHYSEKDCKENFTSQEHLAKGTYILTQDRSNSNFGELILQPSHVRRELKYWIKKSSDVLMLCNNSSRKKISPIFTMEKIFFQILKICQD